MVDLISRIDDILVNTPPSFEPGEFSLAQCCQILDIPFSKSDSEADLRRKLLDHFRIEICNVLEPFCHRFMVDAIRVLQYHFSYELLIKKKGVQIQLRLVDDLRQIIHLDDNFPRDNMKPRPKLDTVQQAVAFEKSRLHFAYDRNLDEAHIQEFWPHIFDYIQGVQIAQQLLGRVNTNGKNDEGEVDERFEHDVEFVKAGENAAKTFEFAEKSFNFIATFVGLPVITPRIKTV